MSRTVCLTLTQLEAEALSYAAFNSLHALEDAEAVFGGRQREISAAYRAAEKLDQAIAKNLGYALGASKFLTKPVDRKRSLRPQEKTS